MTCIGLDPGTELHAAIIWDGNKILEKLYRDTDFIIAWLYAMRTGQDPPPLVIERIVPYGKPIGESTMETIFCSGRFTEAYGSHRTYRMTRLEVKQYLCHNGNAKDGHIRRALIDRLGPIGTKKRPGPLHGVSGDLFAALAVAVTWHDLNREK